jgi:hypothetical protein
MDKPSKKEMNSIRQEVILTTGLCLNPNCTAHDTIVLRIWEYKCEAAENAYENGVDAVQYGITPGGRVS